MGKPSYAFEWSGGFYPGFPGFQPPLMNDRLDISVIALKGPKNPNKKKISRTPICGITVM